MENTETARVSPQSETRAAVLTAARLGHGLLRVARRNGISTHEAWGMLSDAVDGLEEAAYRRGYRDGRRSAMPHLPRVA
jgi:hypothetical protein